MEESTVTISLKEYDHLRDKAQINILMINKMTDLEFRLRELENKIYSMCGVKNITL